jgi:hypothetical protein
MILHRKPTRFAARIQNDSLVRSSKNIGQNNSSKRTFAKI